MEHLSPLGWGIDVYWILFTWGWGIAYSSLLDTVLDPGGPGMHNKMISEREMHNTEGFDKLTLLTRKDIGRHFFFFGFIPAAKLAFDSLQKLICLGHLCETLQTLKATSHQALFSSLVMFTSFHTNSRMSSFEQGRFMVYWIALSKKNILIVSPHSCPFMLR